MSGAQLLEFGSEPRFGNLSFPDLEARFGRHLEQVRSVTDLDSLIRSINPLFQDERYSPDELARLKRLRQRAYDRKRNPRFQTPESLKPLESKSKVAAVPKSEPSVTAGANMSSVLNIESAKGTFADGALRSVGTDSAYWLKILPPLLAWFGAAALVSFFLWQQSFALYESAGFINPTYSAVGGILMIIGFAAYHSITRSWLALFFCVYAGAYEGYLMISGTINDEQHIKTSALQGNAELMFLSEQANKEHEHYQELKQRYDNPESKVYRNDWFLKNHLNPAWQANEKALGALIAKEAALNASSDTKHITWLKIFYRLGLVFLCMMLVHRFFANFGKNPLFKESEHRAETA